MNVRLPDSIDRPTYDTLPHAEVTDARPVQRTLPESVSPSADRYRLLTTLGTGGMGRVTLCHDTRTGRDVAVKELAEDITEAAASKARFLREARIQAQLDHPCVVPVFDIEVDGPLRFTMRYVRGERLSDVIDRLGRGDREMERRFSRRRLLAAFVNVCSALHYAHSRGVIHRDLKPENVMLGDFGEVYVLDWGIARVLEGSRTQVDAELPKEYATQRGCIIGTPGFIAPESWIGAEVDARSDVYALGVMLFEILTLGACHIGADAKELMRATFCERPPVPSQRRPDLDIPAELDAICNTAMALVREERFASADAMREAVERYLDGGYTHHAIEAPVAPIETQRPPDRTTGVIKRRASVAVVALLTCASAAMAHRGCSTDVSSSVARASTAPAPLDHTGR